jgi:hypothetical protein
LQGAPWNYVWGQSIFAKIIASNIYGDSIVSELGNGARLITYPDAPISVQEDIPNRAPNSISLKWTEGINSGGSVINDYRVSMTQGSDPYQVIETAALTTAYTATGLNAGEYYKFKIESRNDAHHSDFSQDIELLCASIPSKPALNTVANLLDSIYIDWDAPADNGLPITSYTVLTQKTDGSFVQDLNYCISDDA